MSTQIYGWSKRLDQNSSDDKQDNVSMRFAMPGPRQHALLRARPCLCFPRRATSLLAITGLSKLSWLCLTLRSEMSRLLWIIIHKIGMPAESSLRPTFSAPGMGGTSERARASARGYCSTTRWLILSVMIVDPGRRYEYPSSTVECKKV